MASSDARAADQRKTKSGLGAAGGSYRQAAWALAGEPFSFRSKAIGLRSTRDRGVASALVSEVVPGRPASDEAADALREQLLDAAARVFASEGYAGAKIMDIVKAAGLSCGAVYVRFGSKDELLLAAVLRQVERNAAAQRFPGRTVAQILVETSKADGELSDVEAMQLEAFIAARRHPNIAQAIAEARERWRSSMTDELVQRAIAEGSASPDADFGLIAYFVETLHLGLLVQRGAGQSAPDTEAWRQMVARVLHFMANPPDRPS